MRFLLTVTGAALLATICVGPDMVMGEVAAAASASGSVAVDPAAAAGGGAAGSGSVSVPLADDDDEDDFEDESVFEEEDEWETEQELEDAIGEMQHMSGGLTRDRRCPTCILFAAGYRASLWKHFPSSRNVQMVEHRGSSAHLHHQPHDHLQELVHKASGSHFNDHLDRRRKELKDAVTGKQKYADGTTIEPIHSQIHHIAEVEPLRRKDLLLRDDRATEILTEAMGIVTREYLMINVISASRLNKTIELFRNASNTTGSQSASKSLEERKREEELELQNIPGANQRIAPDDPAQQKAWKEWQKELRRRHRETMRQQGRTPSRSKSLSPRRQKRMRMPNVTLPPRFWPLAELNARRFRGMKRSQAEQAKRESRSLHLDRQRNAFHHHQRRRQAREQRHQMRKQGQIPPPLDADPDLPDHHAQGVLKPESWGALEENYRRGGDRRIFHYVNDHIVDEHEDQLDELAKRDFLKEYFDEHPLIDHEAIREAERQKEEDERWNRHVEESNKTGTDPGKREAMFPKRGDYQHFAEDDVGEPPSELNNYHRSHRYEMMAKKSMEMVNRSELSDWIRATYMEANTDPALAPTLAIFRDPTKDKRDLVNNYVVPLCARICVLNNRQAGKGVLNMSSQDPNDHDMSDPNDKNTYDSIRAMDRASKKVKNASKEQLEEFFLSHYYEWFPVGFEEIDHPVFPDHFVHPKLQAGADHHDDVQVGFKLARDAHQQLLHKHGHVVKKKPSMLLVPHPNQTLIDLYIYSLQHEQASSFHGHHHHHQRQQTRSQRLKAKQEKRKKEFEIKKHEHLITQKEKMMAIDEKRQSPEELARLKEQLARMKEVEAERQKQEDEAERRRLEYDKHRDERMEMERARRHAELDRHLAVQEERHQRQVEARRRQRKAEIEMTRSQRRSRSEYLRYQRSKQPRPDDDNGDL